MLLCRFHNSVYKRAEFSFRLFGQVEGYLNNLIHESSGILLIGVFQGSGDDLVVRPNNKDTAGNIHKQLDGFKHPNDPGFRTAVQVINKNGQRTVFIFIYLSLIKLRPAG